MGSKPNITVALAQNGDGEAVKRLVLAAGYDVPELDWENIYRVGHAGENRHGRYVSRDED